MTLTPTDAINDGNGGLNYTVTFIANTTGQITPATLTVTGITASNKVYDSTTVATLITSGAGLAGVKGSDSVSLGTSGATGTFATQNVGTAIVVSVSGLTASGPAVTAGDYTLAQPTASANITPATLTVTGITASNKVYDSTTVATLTTSGAGLVGVKGSDSVSLGTSGATGTFATQNVGTAIVVSVSGLTASGPAVTAGDYTLAQPTTSANITPATLTVTGITASNKVYDSTTVATLTTSGAGLVGVKGSDSVSLGTSGATGTFATQNVGTAIVVSVSGLTASGPAVTAGDYTLAQPTTSANITPATLTVTGITASNKVYDSTTVATLTTSVAGLAGVKGSDSVSLSTSGATGTFATQNVGTAIVVSVSGLTASGAAVTAGDYTLAQPTMVANIIARPITVAAASCSRVYDGTAMATALPTITSGSLVGSDTGTFSESYGTKNAGTGLTLTPAAFIRDGNGGANYAVTLVPSTAGEITARAITVTAAPNTKTFDGSTSASAAPIVTSGSLATGDTATFSESYDTPNPGTGKTLNAVRRGQRRQWRQQLRGDVRCQHERSHCGVAWHEHDGEHVAGLGGVWYAGDLHGDG